MNRILGAGFALLLLMTTGRASAETPLEPVHDSVLDAPPPPATIPKPVTASASPVKADPRAGAEAAPQPQTSRVQLMLSAFSGFVLDLTSRSSFPGALSVDRSIVGGGMTVGADVFFQRLSEDDSPRLLQPFLQRASTFAVYAGGRSTRTGYSQLGREFAHEEVSRGFAEVDLVVYPTRSARIAGSLGFHAVRATASSGFSASTSPTLFAIPVDIGIGTRMGDTLIEAVYGVQPQSDEKGRWTVPFWGSAGISLRSVILRRHDLSLGVRGLSQGAAIGARFASYPTQSFGWWLGLNYSYQSYAKALRGELGLSYFGWRRLGGQLSFQPAWSSASSFGQPGSSYFEGTFSLTLFSRA